MNKIVLGIDIGGTNMRGAVVNRDAVLKHREQVNSGADKGISELIDNLVKFVSYFEKYEPAAITVGIPGIVDSDNGTLTQAPNIRNVRDYPLKDTLERKISSDIPVFIENDANCAAVGEFWTGSGKQTSSMIMMTIGTGLGGGIILNGDLWRGEDGMGGEIGHINIDPDGPLCNCGNYGCLESFVSARALDRIVRNNRLLSNKFSGLEYHEIPKILTSMAEKGNTEALNIWKETGINLGIGITTLVNLLNIEMIVIGGGVSNAWSFFIEHARKELLKRGLRAPAKRVKITRSSLGDDAGILGAAYIAFRETEMNRDS